MGHILQDAVSVELSANGIPLSFVWRDRAYRVAEVQELWRLMGAWWDGEGEYTFFRLLTSNRGLYELCYDHSKRVWSLSSVQD